MRNPIEAVLRVVTILLGLVLLVGVGLNFTNAAMRYGLGISLRWAEEIMVFGLVMIVSLGLIVTTARAEHLRIDLLQGLMPAWARIIGHLIMAATLIYLSMQSQFVVSMMLRLGQESVAARVPMWIPHGFVLVGFWGGAAASFYAIYRELRPGPAANAPSAAADHPSGEGDK